MTQYDATTEKLARLLGWVSLGLGASMVLAPRTVTKISGVDDSLLARLMVRAVGARELVHAAGLLAGKPEWVWTRVAGDAMDLPALLIATANRRGTRQLRGALATAMVAGITAADVYTALRVRQESESAPKGQSMRVHAAVTVNCAREDAYRFWQDSSNFPKFMIHLESIQASDGGRLHWRAEAPLLKKTIEWDAEIVEDRPGELIMWRSVEGHDGSEAPAATAVHFDTAPGGRGTEVRVEMDYRAWPAGRVGMAMARLAGEAPHQQVRDDLRRFKQVMEVGEIVRSEGSPRGTHTHELLRQRPAQPVG